VACPFFMPTERLQGGGWQHASRLPLGGGWSGRCTAPGHEGEVPAQEALLEFCNLGYATHCARLPQTRAWDAVRFALTPPKEVGAPVGPQNGNGSSANRVVQLRYSCERGHLPVEHGSLQFDLSTERWIQKHGDARVQKMAECFLESHMPDKER